SQAMGAFATPRGRTQEYAVAIIAAGMSGVYCGWRLIGADGSPRPRYARLVVCERSPRIGGRLNTLVPPRMPNLRAEIGGMRYTTTQPLIRSLVEKQLRLPWKGFPVSNPDSLNYLRGRHLHNSDFADPAKVPYNLLPFEQGKTGLQLILQGISAVVPGAERFTARDWQNVRERGTLDGCSFVSIGLLEYAHARAEHGGDITRHRRPWLRSSDLQLECRGGDDFLLFRLCTGCSIPHSSGGLHGSAGAACPRVSSRWWRDSTTTRAAELYVGSKASTISSNFRRDGSTRRNVGAAPTMSEESVRIGSKNLSVILAPIGFPVIAIAPMPFVLNSMRLRTCT